MNIEIIAIGDELLAGKTANTNAKLISEKLYSKGYRVNKHHVIKDSVDCLATLIGEIFIEPSLVICTGGLGPTIDDLTKKAMQKSFDLELEVDQNLLKDLEVRFPGQSILENQATVIKGSHLIENKLGTAPGMIYTFAKGKVILLPGVPSELEAMLGDVLAFIESSYTLSSVPFVRSLGVILSNEPEVDPIIRGLQEKHSGVEFGIYPNFGNISLSMTSLDEKELEEVVRKILLAFPRRTFFSENTRIEEAVHSLLIERGKSLALAESCSGGLLASCFTKQPDSSKYFMGSIVSYSNELKQKLLGVEEDTLEKFGAVSSQTVSQMLQGLFEKTDSDYGVAISGAAGPSGGTENTPVGTVFIGVGKKGEEPIVQKTFHRGNRARVTESTIIRALSVLYQKIKYESS